MNNDLLKCRFCDESEKLEIVKVKSGYSVRCRNCGESTCYYSIKTDAINAWNWVNKGWRIDN